MYSNPRFAPISAATHAALRLGVLVTLLLAGLTTRLSAQTQKSGDDLGPCPRDETGAIDGDLSLLVKSNDPEMLKDPCYRWLHGLDKPKTETRPAAVAPPASRSGATPESSGPSLRGAPRATPAAPEAAPLSEGDAERALQEALAGIPMTVKDIEQLYEFKISNETRDNAVGQARKARERLGVLIEARTRAEGSDGRSSEEIADDNFRTIEEFAHLAFLAELRDFDNRLLFPTVMAMIPVAAKMAIAAATSGDPNASLALQRLRSILIGMDAAAQAGRKQPVLP